jgi:flagella basal body P-ring formation protein FlgA
MRRPILPLLVALAAAVLALPAPRARGAESPSAGVAEPASISERVREFALAELARSQSPLRAEITVGEIDSRLHLAPCAQTEVFLRPGARLWGRGFVGYRCLQRPGWSVSVPVTVHLYGPALVAAEPIPANQPIAPSAVRVAEVDVTQEAGGVLKDPSELADKTCSRALDAGQIVPLGALRSVPAVTQGEPVKIVGSGVGFSITTDGTAMATAAPGEMVRVRTESGRMIAGVARRGRVVEVSF